MKVADLPNLSWNETALKIEALCKKHGFPAPEMGELLPTAMPKVLALIEHLDKRIEDLDEATCLMTFSLKEEMEETDVQGV